MITFSDTECCGVKEISGVCSTAPTDVILQAAEFIVYRGNDCAFVTMTDLTRHKCASGAKKIIEQNKLGKVLVSGSRLNPNSRNRIRVYVWEVNNTALRKWWAKQDDDHDDIDDDY